MNSIVKCIYEHSLEQPQKTAVIATDHNVDYSTLWKLISSMAVLLKSNGIQKGDRVMLEASHTVEFLVCCYGIHLAGAVHVPLESGIPAERVREIGREIQPKMVLTGNNPMTHFGISLMDLLMKNNSDYVFPEADMLQEILFTTGTTGKSKGVMVTHRGQMNMCISQNAVLNYSKDNLWLIPSPMNHAAGLRKMHMSMVKGSSVLLMNGFTNLKKFFGYIKAYRVTSLYLPPAGIRYILTVAAKELAKYNDQLDFIYSSSSALPGGDKDKLIKLLPDVRKFDAYGGSEVGAVCYIDYNAVKGDSRCMGKPNPGVEIFIVDEDYNRIKSSPQKPGIIAIKSNTVTAGYWNEPELTAKTIQNGIIYMSDLGYIDDNGYLYLVGRRDDVINTGGFKVAPTEVEEVALKLPMVADCACIPYDDKVLGRVVKMYVCLKEGYQLDSDEITKLLGNQLETYKIPKYIEAIGTIPRTFNGKIDRKKLINHASQA
jgi:acyl-coenzyme A synthetase/AMP-(fatty) acid ligase